MGVAALSQHVSRRTEQFKIYFRTKELEFKNLKVNDYEQVKHNAD